MEFLFGLIALVFAVGMVLLIPYLVYGKWSQAKRAIRNSFIHDSGVLGLLMILFVIICAMVIFVLLCAMNNSIWHLDYWTTEGLWKK